MKKVFILVALVCAAFVSNAQDFKAKGGAKNLELQLAPLGGSPISISGIRYRQFLSDNSAFRVNLFAGYHKESEITQQANSDAKKVELVDANSNFTLNIRPGYEMHMAGTERLAPYFGAELDFAMMTSKEVKETQHATEEKKITTTTTGTDGSIRFGLNAVMGCDFYVVKNLYLGAEFGFGFSMNSKSDIKVDSDAEGFKAPDPVKQGSSFDLGPNVIGQFRLGYIF